MFSYSTLHLQPRAPRRRSPILRILRTMTTRPTLLLIAFLSLCLCACGNPTSENAARTLNRQAAQSGSPYRYRSKSAGDGMSTVEKYDPRTGQAVANGQ
jgi:hypothetical protein